MSSVLVISIDNIDYLLYVENVAHLPIIITLCGHLSLIYGKPTKVGAAPAMENFSWEGFKAQNQGKYKFLN